MRVVLPALCGALHLCAATLGNRDLEFDKYPLDKWLVEAQQSHLKWHVEFPPAELSNQQRLVLRAVAHIDGRELEKRRGRGEFISLLQYRDATGHVWQNHASLSLAKTIPGLASNELTVTHYAFLLPGDYTVTAGIVVSGDPVSEHSLIVRKIHVGALKTDPLPNAWDGLPAVEFIPSPQDAPDVWFLPQIQSRLNLTLKSRRRVHLQVLVNTTPTERASGSASTVRHNMSLLIPALRILSQVDVQNGSLEAALLDLTHRRVPFAQQDPHPLDWDLARQYFLDLKPGIVDVRTLQGQWKMRGFFHDEVVRRLAPRDDALQIVIILSGPAFMEDQEPAELSLAPSPADRRIFYVRYRTNPIRVTRMRPRPGMKPPPVLPASFPMPVDDLERTVEPLGARLFDATSAEQFRRVLAAILDQISEM